jgi:hypothetical protein
VNTGLLWKNLKIFLGGPRHRCGDNIQAYLKKEIGFDRVKWILLVQDQLLAVVNAVVIPHFA